MSEQSSPVPNKRSNSELLWDVVQTFSDEAQGAAKRKAIDQGFSLERGEIPFEETLINLSRNRDILIKSIESRAITQLPLKLQNSLVADVNKVAAQLASLLGGIDAILPFESAVDDLTATIWLSGLENMSGQILGFHEKLNQLKTLEKSLRELNQRADSFKKSEDRATSGLSRLDEAMTVAANSVGTLQNIVSESQQKFDLTSTLEQKFSENLLSAQKSEKLAMDSATAARNASLEVDALRERTSTAAKDIEVLKASYESLTGAINNFKLQTETGILQAQEKQRLAFEDLDKRSEAQLALFTKTIAEKEASLASTILTTIGSSVDAFNLQSVTLASDFRTAETLRVQNAASQLILSTAAFEKETKTTEDRYRNLLDELKQRAESNVTEHNTSASELMERLKGLENQVDGAILRATGFSLFHSFQKRQEDLQRSTRFWAYSLGVCAALSVGASLTFLHYLPSFSSQGPAIYFKISLSLPFIFALTFCSLQYTRERRLEEEYAFKSNISISLKPYQKLVEDLVNQDDPIERAIYTKFIVDSIGRIFNSPTGLVFDGDSTEGKTASGLLKVAGDVAENIIKTKLKG